MKKITVKWLTDRNACVSEDEKLIAEKEFKGDIIKILDALIYKNRFLDANWLFTEYANKKQCVLYAIFAAELVLHIFENKYPKDKRPKEAIQAAKDYVKNPCKKTKDAADAAADAAYAAYDAADAANAASAASYAAYASANAAYASSASYASASAAYASSAAYAASAAHASASAAYAAKKELQNKIIKNAISILTRRTKYEY